MNCAFSDRVVNFFDKSAFLWNDLVSAAKCSKICSRKIFDKFSFFWRNLVEVQLLLVFTEPTGRIGLNELCLLWKGDQFLREECLYLKWSGFVCNKFQSVLVEPFLTYVQFLRNFSIGQTFTYDRAYRPNWVKWTVPPHKGWPIFKRNVSLLETISYRLQEVPKSAPRTIFYKFSVFWGILV